MLSVMTTLVPLGESLIVETVPICTPESSTDARVRSPPTLAVLSVIWYVLRKPNVVPLLKRISSIATSARHTNTNSPTFHSSRFWLVLAFLLRHGDALNEVVDDRI